MNYHFHNEVSFQVNSISLKGELVLAEEGNAIVVFSHGSGSSRLSKRNKMVASYLNEKKFGTLLFDLLTEKEDQDYYNRFDMGAFYEDFAQVSDEEVLFYLDKLRELKKAS